eukprot:2323793-Pleurochrysis_carterae.AAC.4
MFYAIAARPGLYCRTGTCGRAGPRLALPTAVASIFLCCPGTSDFSSSGLDFVFNFRMSFFSSAHSIELAWRTSHQ